MLCAALLLACGIAATASARVPPSLHITDMRPVQVRGSHFRPLERVRVTVVIDNTRHLRIVRSTRVGAFVATFAATVTFDPCTSSLAAYATGARGDKATMTVAQRLCPPPE
jgi:hypothetical protein